MRNLNLLMRKMNLNGKLRRERGIDGLVIAIALIVIGLAIAATIKTGLGTVISTALTSVATKITGFFS